MNRRLFIQLLAGASLGSQSHGLWSEENTRGISTTRAALASLAALEQQHKGRLGIAALDSNSGRQLEFRADERFPLCSTFKFMAAAAILKRSQTQADLLAKQIHYTQKDLVTYSPITEKKLSTEKHRATSMNLAELCKAALQYSDNTAGNLLLRELGGPAALTRFARGLGDKKFQLERWETELNTAIPGDARDTSTPLAMLQSMNKLLLGKSLHPAQQQQLIDWLKGNTTGAKRIRAGLPTGWMLGDKTGSGDYGTGNDIAIIFPPHKKPLLLCIYFTQPTQNADWNNQVIADATKIVVKHFELTAS